jgi:hypothetical protein
MLPVWIVKSAVVIGALMNPKKKFIARGGNKLVIKCKNHNNSMRVNLLVSCCGFLFCLNSNNLCPPEVSLALKIKTFKNLKLR